MKKYLLFTLLLLLLSGCGGGENENEGLNSSGSTNTGGNSSRYVLTAWNDLGMHCMDGRDFSVFSILPPYNNLHAQLKRKDGGLVSSGVTITYEATTGIDGKINSTSSDKTNFWQYAVKLFPELKNLPDDTGLTGNKVPNTTPQELKYNPTHKWWEAEGIPITPYNNDGSKNYYPLILVKAKDANGNVLATAKVVLPVSDEMDCKRCHSSNSPALEAKPSKGWVNMSDPEKDFKFNVLRLHDEKNPNAVKNHITELKQKGFDYNTSGLEATARAGTPILCASCHSSNALPGTGVSGVKPFTQAIHSLHAKVTDPYTNLSLDSSKNRASCYACHPGQSTKCLRGAMGDAKDSSGQNIIQCQNCHGTMSKVGNSNRAGWLDEPNCQACHHDSIRETSAVNANGTLKSFADKRFATNSNTPMQGKSLYRFSTGHGKMQCEACHGSPHAIYPAHTADNILSKSIQGHAGTIGECSACHSSVPKTINGGPHGMHTIGQYWVNAHGDIAENNTAQCKSCHGSNYRGSVLSETFSKRTFSTEWGTKTFPANHKVSCYDCHNGPGGGD